jgi:hypothetical protein
MHRILVTIGTLAAVFPNIAVGQAPIDSALGRVRAGDVIRVRTLDGRLAASRLIALDGAPLHFRLRGQPVPVPVASVDSLWVRGHATKLGARVGAALGAIGFGLYLGWACSDPEVGVSPGTCVVLAMPIGGLAGGILGLLVGSAFPRWDLRFPVP